MPNVEFYSESTREKGSGGTAGRGTVQMCCATSRVVIIVDGTVTNVSALLVFATEKMPTTACQKQSESIKLVSSSSIKLELIWEFYSSLFGSDCFISIRHLLQV